MRKLMALSTFLCAGLGTNPQISLQTSFTTGFAFPLSTNQINSAFNGNAMHYGSHIDLLTGEKNLRLGFGGFAGQIIGLNTGDYKTIAQEVATRNRLVSDKFVFNESAFRSSAFFIGPVADVQLKHLNLNFWAKGGYSLNEPGRFSATIQDAGSISRVFITQAGSNKNSFACNLGGGLRYSVNETLSFQLAANYFDTKTDLVNYNYDREKGIAPLNYTAHNSFIQAIFGLHMGINGRRSTKTYENKTDKDIVTGKYIVKSDGLVYDIVSNQNENNREAIPETEYNRDTIIFDPQTIQLKRASDNFNGSQLQATNNYLTGFIYRTPNGINVSQCTGQKTPGDPIPGLDVKLKNRNSNQTYNVRTNEDGSFSVKNMESGNYEAYVENASAFFSVNNKTSNADYKLVEIETGDCGITSNNLMYAEGLMYAEVITAREVSSGLATGKLNTPRDIATGQSSGKRTHKPFPVIHTEYDLNYNNIVRVDGLLYAEVKSARESSSGIASGKRTFLHGDLDGDGMADRISPRDAASGQATGKRQHGTVTIVKSMNDESANQQIDKSQGQTSGKRQHGTVTIVKGFTADQDIYIVGENDSYDAIEFEVKSPRDVATGQSSGRMTRNDLDRLAAETGNVYVLTPRDASSGQASGKRQYNPVRILKGWGVEENYIARDVATGQSSGKRQHGFVRNMDNDGIEYNVKSPRDAASGQATGKRTHKPIRWSNDPYSEDASRMFIVEGSSGNTMELQVPLVLEGENTGTWNTDGTYAVRATKTRSNIQNNRMSNSTENQNKATVNTTRSNIKKQQTHSGSGDDTSSNKATINTTRSNIKSHASIGNIELLDIERIHCTNGTCSMNAIINIDGIEYEAVISGVLKTKHDTAKNSIGNIR